MTEILLVLNLVLSISLLFAVAMILVRSDKGTLSEVKARLETLGQRMEAVEASFRQESRSSRQETVDLVHRLGADQRSALETFGRQVADVQKALQNGLNLLMEQNEKKLEQVRQTVDEKLQKTLEIRLGQSFGLVSRQLEQVQQGLGEMRHLAAGVGDLKKVLSNVKNRGILGELQLSALLEEMLAPGQYAANVQVKLGSRDQVEFAIKLPGRDESAGPVWLPIDAKFPREDYEQLQNAWDSGDLQLQTESRKQLELRVKSFAKEIRDKYIDPPNTTEFALMFLPFEGLYAEVLRIPGLFENLQKDFRVTITGPTTLSAFLNSLQMGFRTLAIQKRSGEVWQLLSMVKKEFGQFGELLDKTKKKLQEATNTLDDAGVRTRKIEKSLREVQGLEAKDENFSGFLGKFEE